MKIITLSDGTMLRLPEPGEIDADGLDAESLDHVAKYLVNLKYPAMAHVVGGLHETSTYRSPAELFNTTKYFDGVKVTPVTLILSVYPELIRFIKSLRENNMLGREEDDESRELLEKVGEKIPPTDLQIYQRS